MKLVKLANKAFTSGYQKAEQDYNASQNKGSLLNSKIAELNALYPNEFKIFIVIPNYKHQGIRPLLNSNMQEKPVFSLYQPPVKDIINKACNTFGELTFYKEQQTGGVFKPQFIIIKKNSLDALISEF